MSSRFNGNPGLYEFLIEAELQQYYNTLKNELKVQNASQLKYVTDEDLSQVGMSRPEIRRLKKYFQKHFPSNVLAKMKKMLLARGDNPISIASLSSNAPSSLGKYSRNVAPGRHIIQADSIVTNKTLGSGEFGTVQQGVWTDHDGQRIQVAIKCLSQDRMENNPVEFLKEAAIMHAVDHEHIVRLYGVVLDTAALMLVTELAPLRSLLECLKESSMRPNLSVPTLYDFTIQICAGMEYLESKRLIHRDLAARNILVFSRNKVKISDFGLSRALGVGKDYYQTNFNVNLKLPIAWCAPECINFLRFTSASDVFAYGVTLWEIFSYGFQPWAALTGQQILEAIDEPNYQRLEKPECCSHEIYYQIMLKCWQHDAISRPSFADLSTRLLPECKPEQVQAIRESERRGRRDYLEYDAGDIISVLEKKPSQGSADDCGGLVWKGVLKDGRTGLFNPANTITYLGSSFPTVKKSPFTRNDSRSSSLRKGRISVDMISGPQGDFKHTGHVGPDGQFFGDITFLGSKTWVPPRQVVPPYKPESCGSETPSSDFSTPIARLPSCSSSKTMQEINGDLASSDTAPLLSTAAQMNMDENDHEYHEISDEENEILGRNRGEMGHSNPALSSKSQSPLDSPRFEKTFDLGGPSLIDEVFGALQQDHKDEAHNVKNELREMARSKKKFATVKPISSSDRKTLDHAIHLANELASRSMLDLDRHGKMSGTNNSLDDISSPRTPNSPNHKRKFSFILGGRGERERRNYSQEAASIPDIQSTLSEEAKEAYNSLVEKPSFGALGFLTPSFENKSLSFHFPEKSSCSSKHSEFFELEPSQKSSNHENAPIVGHSSNVTNSSGIVRKSKPRNLSLPDERMVMSLEEGVKLEEEVDGNPLRLLRQTKTVGGTNNVLPLPPRDRQKTVLGAVSGSQFPRHQRKHPLLIPSKISIASNQHDFMPPPPPPKPVRQHIKTQESICQEILNTNVNDDISNVDDGMRQNSSSNEEPQDSVLAAVIESLKKNQSSSIVSNTADKIKLYENYESASPEINQQGNLVSGPATMKPRVPRGDSPLKTILNQNSNSIQSVHRRVASLDLSSFSTSVQDSSQKSSFETHYQPDHNLLKIRTVRRILGSSATDEDCKWAVEATNDAAHAVKLLRLKSLLPETLLLDGVGNILSALEMSHWDVARAAGFLLDRDTARSKGNGRSKLQSDSTSRSRSRSEYSSFVCNENFTSSSDSNDTSNNNLHNNNGLPASAEFSHCSAAMSGTSNVGDVNSEHIRPTRV